MDKLKAQRPLKSLVLCADDYAFNAPISQAIVTLATQGRLSATSVMTLSPRWADDVSALREVRDRLSVGVHLDWTSAFAIQAGHGSLLSEVMVRSVLNAYDKQKIKDEMHRQIDAFELHWHDMPEHIDGHQHIQQFGVFRDALADVLLSRYGSTTKRPWLRISHMAQPGIKAQIISWMGARALHEWAIENSWPCVSPMQGAYGFDGQIADYARHMKRWLANAPDANTSLLMCHPATSALADDAIGAAREREFAYLASDEFAQHLSDAGVVLVRH